MKEKNELLQFLDEYKNFADTALKRIFKGEIKESFLIKMKYRVLDLLGTRITDYYNMNMEKENVISGRSENIQYDICRHIVGLHKSNTIFLSDEERSAKEKSEDYQKQLADEVLTNIRLRNYGSCHFRQQSIIQGDQFICYHVPYYLFVMCSKITELIVSNSKNKYFAHYAAISHKVLAVLTLLENNLFDSAYPICRVVIELYLKLWLLKIHPELVDKEFEFLHYELEKTQISQSYPKEFTELYKNRTFQKYVDKIDYLHYGWLDNIAEYHTIVKQQPYSIKGIITYLKSKGPKLNYQDLEYYYKMCHGFTHGNAFNVYPVVSYFDICLILSPIVANVYYFLCSDLNISTDINGIGVVEKWKKHHNRILEQYKKITQETIEQYYSKTDFTIV